MAGQQVGYIRVSSFDQNPERQLGLGVVNVSPGAKYEPPYDTQRGHLLQEQPVAALIVAITRDYQANACLCMSDNGCRMKWNDLDCQYTIEQRRWTDGANDLLH